MSFESPKEQASAEAARTQSQYASKLADVSFPQLNDILGRVTGDLSATGIAPSVQNVYGQARQGMESDFASAQRGQQAYIGQQFAQSGGIYNTNQVSDTRIMAAHNLDVQRKQAEQSLNFQEAAAGMQQYNSLINLLSGGAGTALGLGGGYSQAQAQAIGGLSNQSAGGGALSGGLAGAGAGASFGPYGALIGGVLGAAGGFYGSGG